MEQQAPGPATSEHGFPSVEAMLEQSLPQARMTWLWYGMGAMAVFALAAVFAMSDVGQDAARGVRMLLLFGVVLAMSVVSWFNVQRARAEQTALQSLEELMQLRRWPEAAMLLLGLLSRPTRTHQTRFQALVYLTSVLSRYHRYGDAVTVQEYLLASITTDHGTEFALKLGRAMALLHEDRLYDADRAISELRRARDPQRDADAAGLAMVELYRDVKTGHLKEAIDTFTAREPVMRRHLGHRVADAHALIARARDLLEQPTAAAQSYCNATLLAPAHELQARYPEIAALAGKYPAAAAPPEMLQPAFGPATRLGQSNASATTQGTVLASAAAATLPPPSADAAPPPSADAAPPPVASPSADSSSTQAPR